MFNRHRLIPFFRGFFPVYRTKHIICPVATQAQGKKLVWRDHFRDTMKLTTGYADKPVELGNFLFLRTREREMLYNRIHKKAETVKYDNFYTTGGDVKALKTVESDLENGFNSLKEILSIMRTKKDLDYPVSFAANALYALEKNGLRNEEMYKKVLFPILKAKAKYLHAEGLSGAIWALGQYHSDEGDLVLDILKQYENKKFGTDVVYVNNAGFSNEKFISAEGSHGIEFDSTKEFSKMYFQDHIVCLELYEGLKNLSSQSLGTKAGKKVSEVMSDLEERQKITSDSYWFYKQISGETAVAEAS